MSNGACEIARGQIALASIGRLPRAEQTSLDAHLEGCAACRIQAASLAGIEAALSRAEPERIDQGLSDHLEEMPVTLRSAVFSSLDHEVVRHRRALRVRFAAAAVAVVLVLGAVGVVAGVAVSSRSPSGTALSRNSTSGRSGTTYALSGTGGAHGTARLQPEPWGSSVHLKAYGEEGGQVLTVSMETKSGAWWIAGTYKTVGGTSVNVTMSCAVPPPEISAVRITNAEGQQVLASYES